MTCIRCKASNRRNTVCISRFDNVADDTSHRKTAAKEVFRGSLYTDLLYNFFNSFARLFFTNVSRV